MAKQIYIPVPTKPIVAQYIQNRYGTPVVFPVGDWLRALALNLLISASRNYDTTIRLSRLSNTVELPFSLSEVEKYGNTFTATSIYCINGRIEDEIHQRLFIFFEYFHAIVGLPIKETAIQFQKHYNFPEEIYSVDNIIKQFQRHIQPHLANKNFSQIVLRANFHTLKKNNATTKQAVERLLAMQEVLSKYPSKY